MHERAREANRVNREGWKYEALRRCRSAGRRIFHLRRPVSDVAKIDC
jgi:hypothetical protein